MIYRLADIDFTEPVDFEDGAEDFNQKEEEMTDKGCPKAPDTHKRGVRYAHDWVYQWRDEFDNEYFYCRFCTAEKRRLAGTDYLD